MSELALQLIAENKKSRNTFLDLANCGLVEIPVDVGELVWLESLSLVDEWWEWDRNVWHKRKSQNTGDTNDELTVITPLAGLTNLRSLTLPYIQVADLSPLASLTALRSLKISGLHISDLSPLSSLTALQRLDLRGTVVDLSPLAYLTALRLLDIGGTLVADLSPLANLTALQTLNIANTRIADIWPLAG